MGLEFFLIQARQGLHRSLPLSPFFLFTAAYLIFLAIGASVFSSIEGPAQVYAYRGLIGHIAAFEKKWRPRDSDEAQQRFAAALDELMRQVMGAAAKGISPLHNVTAEPVWTFGQSFFFAGTLVSTVGYGHMSPSTHAGKLFTIVYCIFGIPLTLFLLSAFVDRLKLPSLWLLGRLRRATEGRLEDTSVQLFHLALVSFAILLFLFLLPSAIFNSLEPGWSYLDAFYYCFISLTTIGLGDYIPGDKPDQDYRGAYKIFTTAYLLIGLCGMMLFLGTLYDIPVMNLGRYLVYEDEEDNERLQLAGKEKGFGPNYTKEPSENGSKDNAAAEPSAETKP